MDAPSPESLVLMYHGIDPGDGRYAGADSGMMAYVIGREVFAEHLDVLAKAGRRIVSPAEYLASPSIAGDVLLSFDDGMLSDYDCAFPILQAAGRSAIFFITTAEVGRTGRVDWAKLREMANAGMELGSHGHTHRFFSAMSETEQREELDRSRKLLEDKVGVSVRALSLPGGRYGKLTLRLARNSGYEAVFTSAPDTPRTRGDILIAGRIAVRAPWTAQRLVDFLGHQDQRLRRMRLSHSLRQFAQGCLGERSYVALHRAIWAMRGK